MTLAFPVAPMRATLGQLPTEDAGWAYEIKWDGYRTLAFVDKGKVRLQSSNLHDVTPRYPEIQPLAGEVGGQRAILDGELVVLDDRGRPRFELIQRKEMDRLEAAYFVFDVLAVNPHDTIGLVYEERRRLLRELLDDGPNWQVPAHRVGDGPALLAATESQELEGVMAKRLGTTYRPGARSKDWRKVKHRRQADVVIGGYTGGTGNRSTTFGSLLVGRWDGGRLAFAGGVGTGFTQQRLEDLKARLDALRAKDCPFDPPPPTAYRRDAVWVRPELTARVELTEFTNEGYVRQSSFIELIAP
jgi:bifunctional non-homologous end joining protein LigD